MSVSKYAQDRLALLLLTVMLFLAGLAVLLVILRLGPLADGSPLIQYRGNLGEMAFRVGQASDHARFAVFALLAAGGHAFMSFKAYHIRRHFAYVVLAAGILLLMLTIIVSNQLFYHS
jgi:cytochrome c biogenesis protein CcdA